MSRSSIATAVGIAAGIACASVALAQDGTPLAQRRLEGRVVSVDPQDHSLTVDTGARGLPPAAPPDAPMDRMSARHRARTRDARISASDAGRGAATRKLVVAPGATVVRDGLNVRFDEVQPGDEVRASFLSDDLARARPWQLELRSPGGVEAPWGVGTGG